MTGWEPSKPSDFVALGLDLISLGMDMPPVFYG